MFASIPLSTGEFLTRLGLGQYIEVLVSNGASTVEFLDMTTEQLQTFIPLAIHRIRILNAASDYKRATLPASPLVPSDHSPAPSFHPSPEHACMQWFDWSL